MTENIIPPKTKKQNESVLLKNSTLFSRLNDEQLTTLAARLRSVTYKRNDVIFLKSDPGDALYIIKSGRVKISILNSDGKDLIINIYGPGEIFGEMSLFDGLPRSAAATALEGVEAVTLSRIVFDDLLGSMPGLASSIISLLSRRLRYTTEQAEMLGLLDAYDRVALKLVQLATNSTSGVPNKEGLLVVSMSQQELAAMLGLTREWLNKVLKVFAEQGVIELNWGKIIIHDLEALKQWI